MLGYGQQAGGTHPTGIHSFYLSSNSMNSSTIVEKSIIFVLFINFYTESPYVRKKGGIAETQTRERSFNFHAAVPDF